jgi:hypothetical protein
MFWGEFLGIGIGCICTVCLRKKKKKDAIYPPLLCCTMYYVYLYCSFIHGLAN